MFLAVFAAGFSFLVYEVVWNRLLSLYLGITVHASTVVISAYMAGLSAGAFFFGKKAQEAVDVQKFISRLLITVAAVNLIVYRLILFLPAIYRANAWGINIGFTAYSYSLVLVFMSAFFIGGFMPAVSRIFAMSGDNTGQAAANTFGFETLGSATGGLLAGFLLLGSLGASGSVFFAAGINILLAAFAAKGLKVQRGLQPEQKAEKKSEKIKKILQEKPRTAMAAVFVSGLCGFIFQITAMRIFRIYLTNTSYTFSLIISVTISGYFAGSMIYRKLSARDYNTEKILITSMFLMAAAVGAGIVVFVNAPEWIILPLHKTLSASWARILIPPAALSMLTVLPQSVLSGIIFTSAVKLYRNRSEKISSGFGRIYFVNTAGAFLGPFTAAFVLIPRAGAVRTLLAVSLILSLFSMTLYFRKKQKSIIFMLTGVSFIIVIFAGLIRERIMILPPSFSLFDREILFYRETVEATLVVGHEKVSGVNHTFFNNNSVIGSSYDAIKAVKLLGHLPFLTGKVPENVLVVGFGIGVTASTILQHEDVKSLECVELAEDLTEAAEFYTNFNNNVTGDPRFVIIGDDGRNYLQRSGKKYDLISSDPTHPVLGSGALYSREYFQLCYDHLTDNGIVTQYLPLHKLMKDDFAGIIATFRSVFENTTVWMGHTHAILYGSKKPLRIDFADFKAAAAKISDPYFYSDPYALASYLILADVSSIAEGKRICTDNRSYLDFFKFRSFDPENWIINAENIRNHYNTEGVFYNIEDTEKFERYKKSGLMLHEALIESIKGDRESYVRLLRKSYAVNPDNQETVFLLRLEAMSQ